MIRDARREARGCRFVPRRQTDATRQLSDFVLLEIGFVERTADTELARGQTAWTVIAAIVGVAPIDDDGVAFSRKLRQVRVELVLAVVTPVSGIRPVLSALQFTGVDDLVPKAELLGNLHRQTTMMFGIAGAVGSDREGA